MSYLVVAVVYKAREMTSAQYHGSWRCCLWPIVYLPCTWFLLSGSYCSLWAGECWGFTKSDMRRPDRTGSVMLEPTRRKVVNSTAVRERTRNQSNIKPWKGNDGWHQYKGLLKWLVVGEQILLSGWGEDDGMPLTVWQIAPPEYHSCVYLNDLSGSSILGVGDTGYCYGWIVWICVWLGRMFSHAQSCLISVTTSDDMI